MTTSSTPGGPDALRTILATSLRDPANRPEKYDGRFAYVTTGDNTGFSSRVFPSGFDGVQGALLLSVPLPAELPGGSTVELSGPCPAVSDGDLFGLNDVIRTTLLSLSVVLTLAFVAVDRQVRYSVASLPWVLRRDEILDVYPDIPSGQTAAQTVPIPFGRGTWDLQYDGEAPYLVFTGGVTAGATFYVRVRRPAGTWVNTNDTWGNSTTGPADEVAGSDPDQVILDAQTVAAAALPLCLQRLVDYWRGRGDDQQVARYEARLQRAQQTGAVTRWLRSFGSSGVQVVGARRGWRRSWGSKGLNGW